MPKCGIGYRICVDNDYVYMTNNKGVVIVDVHQPKKPKKVGMIPTGVTFGICVDNGLAYVSGESGLTIADIRNPENPRILDEYVIGGVTQGITVNESFGYITSSKGLDILYISDSNMISPIAHIDNIGMRAVEVSDDIAYLAVPSIGVYEIDEYGNVNAAHDICSDGNFIFVASASKGLMVLQLNTK